MLVNPQAQTGQIPGSNGAPYVVLGDQWIGYDDVNYVTRKVRHSYQDIFLYDGILLEDIPDRTDLNIYNITRANLKNNSNILKVFVPSCLNSFNQFTNKNNHLPNTTKLFVHTSAEQIFSSHVYLMQVNYLKQRGLGGFMIWSLDLDDFSGTCGQGNYPLLTAINQALTGSIVYVTTMKVFAWLCYYCTISWHVCIYVRLRESNLSIKVRSQ